MGKTSLSINGNGVIGHPLVKQMILDLLQNLSRRQLKMDHRA